MLNSKLGNMNWRPMRVKMLINQINTKIYKVLQFRNNARRETARAPTAPTAPTASAPVASAPKVTVYRCKAGRLHRDY